MALEISYWTASRQNPNIPGDLILAETRSLSGTSQRSAATPSNAVYVCIEATEAARFDYSSPTSTASATTPYMGSGKERWMDAHAGYTVAGITG